MRTKIFANLAALFAAMQLVSCSLVVDFTQCETDNDCPAKATCLGGICEESSRVAITDHVVVDTTWRADKVYVLENLTLVVPPATLTIEPGTTILGRRNTGLVSLAGARLVAEGTREKPIVFTSDKPAGQRVSGDWAGLAMVGRAPTNRANFNFRIITDKYDTAVGGTDETWNCGTLKYVRVEFGGSTVEGQQALKGVTLAGCGSQTEVAYVQTHLSDDDGFGIFGGNVDLRYVVSSRARVDAFDFDTGWTGTAQFIAVLQDVLAAEALEIENLAEDTKAEPNTFARIYNYTLIGGQDQGQDQTAIYFKNGGQGLLSHGIVKSYNTTGIYIEGPDSAQYVTDNLVNVQNTLFFDIGPTGNEYFGLIDTNEGGFTDYAVFQDPETKNVFGKDPGIDAQLDLANPNWLPTPEFTTGREIEPPPEGFDPTAVYRGAFSPSAPPWTDGWTAYPLN